MNLDLNAVLQTDTQNHLENQMLILEVPDPDIGPTLHFDSIISEILKNNLGIEQPLPCQNLPLNDFDILNTIVMDRSLDYEIIDSEEVVGLFFNSPNQSIIIELQPQKLIIENPPILNTIKSLAQQNLQFFVKTQIQPDQNNLSEVTLQNQLPSLSEFILEPVLNLYEFSKTIKAENEFADELRPILLEHTFEKYPEILNEIDRIQPAFVKQALEIESEYDLQQLNNLQNAKVTNSNPINAPQNRLEIKTTQSNSSQNAQIYIFKQVQDQFQIMISQNKNNATVQLEPQELGKIEIELTNDDNQTHVVFNVSQESTKIIIENNLDNFRSLFQSQGLELGDVNISSNSHSDQSESQKPVVKKSETSTPENFSSQPKRFFNEGQLDLYA